MKKTLLAIAVLGTISTVASAQTNVTIYGVIDTAIRFTNNQVTSTGTLGKQTAMTEGSFQGSRIGFKGSEDLGGGTSAIFQLENGFQSNNGATDQQGQIFGRQAFVGLRSKTLGEFTVGRQYGLAFETLGNYDPLGIGNFVENEWASFLYGIRFDNTAKYTKSFGPVTAALQYSFGEQAGKTSIGSTVAGSLNYTQGTFNLGGVYQQSKDANSAEMKLGGVGTAWGVGPATLYLQVFQARRDPGFAKAASNSGGPLANTSMTSNSGNTLRRTDSVLTTGVLYQATPAMGFTLGYMYDKIKNVSSAGDKGRISSVYAVADYNLSKRTDVYVEVDRTTLGGGEIQDVNGVMPFAGSSLGAGGPNTASSRNGVGIGLRHKF
ncbi:porin [Paraherbaspirillum soli]|uniref:Porin n=1 Tax=Paraherbaspirillum soli TaxID=631222 RepID=A0ABW0MBW1_9BURK